ncbi:MAG: hypothetical protein ACI31S_01495 [Bacilli bacterium]
MEDINKDIEILENLIRHIRFNEPLHYGISLYIEALEHLIKAYKELKEENEKLKSDNLEYQRTQDIFDERTYRKKYLEERRKEEPNLLYPDSDEIYKRYYKLKEENARLKKAHNISENVTIQDITNVMNKSLEDFNREYIPVSLVEETIEELNKKRDDYLYKLQLYGDFRINEPNYSDLILQINFKIQVLQELLKGDDNGRNMERY